VLRRSLGSAARIRASPESSNPQRSRFHVQPVAFLLEYAAKHLLVSSASLRTVTAA